jgi:hypothetical protein
VAHQRHLFQAEHLGFHAGTPIPLKIPAGATVELAIRTNANGHARLFSVQGVEANSLSTRRATASIKNLTPDTAGTLAGVVNVPGTDTWIVSADVDDDYDARS